MHAELKHPKYLKTKYGRLDLQDIDFHVDVGISEDINMVIPSSFRHELETGVLLLRERNPHKKAELGYEHTRAMRSRGKETNVEEALANLQTLFVPSTFCEYIDVKEQFHYSECRRGNNHYINIPIPTWPENMKIVSRTDLGLENCAAKGVVIYKREDFQQRVCKLLGIK